jgi:IS30 family transposase
VAGPWMTDEEKATIWRMARAGSNWVQISRHLGRHVSAVHNYARWHGGVPPRARHRSQRQLSLVEREEISRGLACGWSIRRIATELGRAPSTVSREVNRNGGNRRYRATNADLAATTRAARPKVCKLAATPRLRAIVEERLRDDWSPEQISRWSRREFPDDPELHVELTAHLRTRRMVRRGKTISDRGHGKGQIVGAIHISERPAEVEDRAVPGHWEGDMLIGARFTQIATLVERQSRFVMLVALPSRSTDDVVPAVAAHIQTLPDQLRKTLTWDRGNEMAKHAKFTVDTGVQVYFCDPRSPWQRGTNENTNGLLRQYFPKGTNLAVHDKAHLEAVAAELNGRPRMTLNWQTPAEALQRLLSTPTDTVATTG